MIRVASDLIPESCMKIKKVYLKIIITAVQAILRIDMYYRVGKNDESHFIFSIFTLRASRRLASAALLRACRWNPPTRAKSK